MKRAFLFIILLSIAHVASAQHQRKNDPVQKVEQGIADKVKSQTDCALQASYNNMINSKNPDTTIITPSVPPPPSSAVELVRNPTLRHALPAQHDVPKLSLISSGDNIGLSRNKIQNIHGIFTEIREDIKNDSIDKACSLLDTAMMFNRESSWLFLQQLEQEGTVQLTPLLHAYADKLAEKEFLFFYDELNLILESFHERKKYKELIELYNNNKQKPWYSTYAPLYLCASIGYLETGDIRNTIETYRKFKNMFDPMDKSLGTYYTYTFDAHTIEYMDYCIQWLQEILHLENADFDRRLR